MPIEMRPYALWRKWKGVLQRSGRKQIRGKVTSAFVLLTHLFEDGSRSYVKAVENQVSKCMVTCHEEKWLFSLDIRHLEVPESRSLTPDVRRIRAVVCKSCNVTEEAFTVTR